MTERYEPADPSEDAGYRWLRHEAAFGSSVCQQLKPDDVRALAGPRFFWPFRVRSIAVLTIVAASVIAAVVVPLTYQSGIHKPQSSSGATTEPGPPQTGIWSVHPIGGDITPGSAIVAAVPGAHDVVLGLRNDQCMEPCVGPIVRVDPTTGATATGPNVSALSFLVQLSHQVVLLSARHVSLMGVVSGGWTLRHVDPRTLRLGPPAPVTVLGDSPVLMAVASGSELLVETTATEREQLLWIKTDGSASDRVELPTNGVGRAAIAPTGEVAYYLEWRAPQGGRGCTAAKPEATLREIALPSGQVLAARKVPDPCGGAEVTAVEGGVVVTDGRPTALYLSANQLRRIALPSSAIPPLPTGQDRGLSAYSARGFVLLMNSRGVTCLDPSTGAVRATDLSYERSGPWVPVGLSGSTVFVVGSGRRLYSVQLPPACLA